MSAEDIGDARLPGAGGDGTAAGHGLGSNDEVVGGGGAARAPKATFYQYSS